MDNYRIKISNAPLVKPISLPIEHCIDLIISPSCHHPRKFLIYSKKKKKNPIKCEIKTLFENKLIEKSNFQYASSIVLSLKKKWEDKNCCRLTFFKGQPSKSEIIILHKF